MQRTRLNSLFSITFARFSLFFQNPWRRIALLIISLLFGNFLGTVVPTTAGQEAAWDPIVGAALLFFTELVSRIYYNRPKLFRLSAASTANTGNQLVFDLLNVCKIGFIYGMFVEALEIGS